MAEDILGQFYTCLNLRLDEKLCKLTKIIDSYGPTKELQVLFPQLINNIFGQLSNNGWNLKTITSDIARGNRHEFEALISFLEPMGPMFRLCYKLMSDQHLKYELPLSVLPLDLQMSLERGRYLQFYTDMLVMDSQTMNYVALALNPFDYYIFNFALHLVNNNQQQSAWENWNSVYFAVACDYLMHFLPSDPGAPVLPHILNYTGKVGIAAPLQTANRPHTPSLLLMPDICGIGNQHGSPQNQSRNEVWRSETVLQVFVDIWMSVDQFSSRDKEIFQRAQQFVCSSPERVRTVRVLVKHIHSYGAKYEADPASRSSALRKYARQIMCARAYHYVKHLVQTWPLDASFRLVLELWLSLIQPWRYTNNTINQDRFAGYNNNQEENTTGALDSTFIQFIAENFPTYTCILQLVLPRFMRMELTAYKNAVMLFRVGKVFSQPHLVRILWNLEQAMTDEGAGPLHRHDGYNSQEQNYTYNGIALQKWVAIAKQALCELNMSATFEYDAMWSLNKNAFMQDFLRKILLAKTTSESIAEDCIRKFAQRHKGVWSNIKDFLMIGHTGEEEIMLEECKKVPVYMNMCLHYFSNIFGISEALIAADPVAEDSSLENSSFGNATNFCLNITNKLRTKPTTIQYMGDPDLMPITSYESTILVRMLYQIATKINEIYGDQFADLYNDTGFWGFVAREVLEKPCTIRSYVKDLTSHQNVITRNLPPRLSLRRLGSHSFIVWITLGYLIFKLFGYNGFTYVLLLIIFWVFYIATKASLKMLKVVAT